jgi:hypothetical protein
MSFGFSPSDIVALIQLTTRAYNGWKNACGTYTSITDDLSVLQSLLSRIHHEANQDSSVFNQDTGDLDIWQELQDGCKQVVLDLENVVNKYKGLSRSRGRNWDRIRLGTKDLSELSRRLANRTSSISAFVSTLGMSSQGRVEHKLLPELIQKVDDIAAQIRAGTESTRSVRSARSAWTEYEGDDKQIWREFRRSLITSGFRGSDVHKYSAALQLHLFRLNREGMLEEEIPREQDHEESNDSSEREEEKSKDKDAQETKGGGGKVEEMKVDRSKAEREESSISADSLLMRSTNPTLPDLEKEHPTIGHVGFQSQSAIEDSESLATVAGTENVTVRDKESTVKDELTARPDINEESPSVNTKEISQDQQIRHDIAGEEDELDDNAHHSTAIVSQYEAQDLEEDKVSNNDHNEPLRSLKAAASEILSILSNTQIQSDTKEACPKDQVITSSTLSQTKEPELQKDFAQSDYGKIVPDTIPASRKYQPTVEDCEETSSGEADPKSVDIAGFEDQSDEVSTFSDVNSLTVETTFSRQLVPSSPSSRSSPPPLSQHGEPRPSRAELIEEPLQNESSEWAEIGEVWKESLQKDPGFEQESDCEDTWSSTAVDGDLIYTIDPEISPQHGPRNEKLPGLTKGSNQITTDSMGKTISESVIDDYPYSAATSDHRPSSHRKPYINPFGSSNSGESFHSSAYPTYGSHAYAPSYKYIPPVLDQSRGYATSNPMGPYHPASFVPDPNSHSPYYGPPGSSSFVSPPESHNPFMPPTESHNPFMPPPESHNSFMPPPESHNPFMLPPEKHNPFMPPPRNHNPYVAPPGIHNPFVPRENYNPFAVPGNSNRSPSLQNSHNPFLGPEEKFASRSGIGCGPNGPKVPASPPKLQAIDWPYPKDMIIKEENPPVHMYQKPTLPEGWDWRSEGQKAFYIDAYARNPERRCFSKPPIREIEDPAITESARGWTRVCTIFGRIHWKHEEEGFISYRNPGLLPKLVIHGRNLFLEDENGNLSRADWNPEIVMSKNKTVVFKKDDTCQIERSFWDHGISDDAVAKRGDLWWSSMNTRTQNVRLSQPWKQRLYERQAERRKERIHID